MFLPASRPFLSLAGSLMLLALAIGPMSRSALADPPDCPESASPLPDSPGTVITAGLGCPANDAQTTIFKNPSTPVPALPPLSPSTKLVTAGRQAPQQRARDKLVLGLRESTNHYAMIGWTLSAGFSHLTDKSPNYGVDGLAFAERFGAAAARNSSKEIFSDGILAAAFHQDPRYYQRGPSHRFLNRATYAATRPFVGRTDGGRTIPNFAFILGTGGAAALTQTYYPERNTTGSQIVRTWGTSLGGSMLGYLVSEFGNEALQRLHISKHE